MFVHFRNSCKLIFYLFVTFVPSIVVGSYYYPWIRKIKKPLLKSGKDPDQVESYKPFSIWSPIAKVIEILMLPFITGAAP